MVPYHVLTLQTSGKMLWSWTCVAALCTLSSLVPISGEVKQKRSRSVWFKAREQHEGLGLSNVELKQIYQLNKLNNFHEHLDPIMIPRVVGTPGHATVRKHLIDTMKALGWTIEENSFTDTTPIGDKTFTNVIATLDPDAPRHLVLACHYDSKIDREREFIGATDSAVPCAMMLQLATVLRDSLNRHRQSCVKKKKKKKSKWKCNKKCRKKCSRREARKFWKKQNKTVDACDGNLGNCAHKLEECCSKACACITTPKHNLKYFGKLRCCTKYKTEKNYTLTFVPFVQSDLTLQFIFFDGEEAFHRWSKTDSLYGSRHLANKLGKTAYPQKNVDRTTHLNRMDLFVLLDLIGTEDVQFFNYFKNTEPWYARMVSYERRLNSLGDVTKRKFMFQPRERLNPGIEDDHIPFLDKGVPIVHLIPVPFPTVWHKSSDNGSALHYPTIENLNVIMQAFVADYLHLYL